MNIGIIGTRGIPNHYGGFEQFAQYLAAGLADRGHEVSVYNSSLHTYKEKTFGKVRIIHCRDWENKIGTAGQFLYDRNCINDSRRRNFDVLLHLGYTSDSVWHRQWPKKTIHIVNMDGLEWKRSKYNAVTRNFLKKAEALAAKNADLLIADSPGIQQHLFATYKKPSVYIPYGATIFNNPGAALLDHYNLAAYSYYLVIARMEPENNIEMIIKGYLLSGRAYPLLLIGNTANKYGRYLLKKYASQQIKFLQGIYDLTTLDNLRYYSANYFHGHSVGGTNPSLLEAMACGCSIAAHDNTFNRAVLDEDAYFFTSETGVCSILDNSGDEELIKNRRALNFQKIQTRYSWDSIIDQYEAVMEKALGLSSHILHRTGKIHL